MEDLYCFNQTVQGAHHIAKGIPCEDASVSFEDEKGRYCIVAVADGHGAPSCFRSQSGAKFAVESALETLREFAEDKLALSEQVRTRFYNDIFSGRNEGRYRNITMRKLTDRVHDGWLERVNRDFRDNPPPRDTLEKYGYAAQDSGAKNAQGAAQNYTHIYGTTLIAAMWMYPGLFLFHQGDGRCHVFYADGTIEQPIPWDARCEGNVTTSLCQEDAKESFRHCVLNLETRPVMACLLASDGVEDAYLDTYEGFGESHTIMGGVHTFFKYICCLAAERDKALMERYLSHILPDFSARGRFSHSGSGDDVSVTGIVKPSQLRGFSDRFQTDIKLYELEDALFWKREELRGKTRKHTTLQNKLDQARREADEAREACQSNEKLLSAYGKEEEESYESLTRAKESKEEFSKGEKRILDCIENTDREGSIHIIPLEVVKLFLEVGKLVVDAISRGLKVLHGEQESSFQSALNHYDEVRNQLINARTKQDLLNSELEDANLKQAAIEQEFHEYDCVFQSIRAEEAAIVDQIEKLKDGALLPGVLEADLPDSENTDNRTVLQKETVESPRNMTIPPEDVAENPEKEAGLSVN